MEPEFANLHGGSIKHVTNHITSFAYLTIMSHEDSGDKNTNGIYNLDVF
jgi:hypothetical protein